jgi:hypothetical protein
MTCLVLALVQVRLLLSVQKLLLSELTWSLQHLLQLSSSCQDGSGDKSKLL